MAIEPREDLKLELQVPEFAKLYGADQARVQLALTLIAARSQLGLRQREIADKLGTSQPYIAKLEKGDANPTISKIGSMLALLNLRLTTSTTSLLSEPTPTMARSSGVTDVPTSLDTIGVTAPNDKNLYNQLPNIYDDIHDASSSTIARKSSNDWASTRRAAVVGSTT